jgi:hypothetical protein
VVNADAAAIFGGDLPVVRRRAELSIGKLRVCCEPTAISIRQDASKTASFWVVRVHLLYTVALDKTIEHGAATFIIEKTPSTLQLAM